MVNFHIWSSLCLIQWNIAMIVAGECWALKTHDRDGFECISVNLIQLNDNLRILSEQVNYRKNSNLLALALTIEWLHSLTLHEFNISELSFARFDSA